MFTILVKFPEDIRSYWYLATIFIQTITLLQISLSLVKNIISIGIVRMVNI